MDSLAFLLSFVCLGVVLGWYIANEEGAGDGGLWLLALRATPGVAVSDPANESRYAEVNSAREEARKAAPLPHLAARKAEKVAAPTHRFTIVDAVDSGGFSDEGVESFSGDNPFRRQRRYKSKDANQERLAAIHEGRSKNSANQNQVGQNKAGSRGSYRVRAGGRYAAKMRRIDLGE